MNLPKSKLNRTEALKLWEETHSEYAKEQVVLSNQALVGEVLKQLHLDVFDDDLWMTGILGLIKSVNTYNSNKGKFSTYAFPIIRNEILMTLRKKRIVPTFSLDAPYCLKDGNEVQIEEIISDEKNMEKEIIESFLINSAFAIMNDKERQIILLVISGKTQKEIAKNIGISQSYASRLIKSIQKRLREEMGVK